MGRIPADFIDAVLEQTDIVALVRVHVKLKKQGRDWLGLCPFHQENTPSFSVSEKKQLFHCFGCQCGGTAIDFVMRHDQLSFPDTIAYLAKPLGMTLPTVAQTPADQAKQARRDRCHALLQAVADYYQSQLAASPQARGYLHSRGIHQQTQTRYQIGFAPPAAPLPTTLSSPSQQADLIETGMLIRHANRLYPRFKNRIMFPIRHQRGHIIGFGGRSLDPNEPAKYLNSPNTPFFHKGKACYGLYCAQRAMGAATHPRLIIVEGYMDVIRLAQSGFEHSVATLGTALTPEQITLLLRYSTHCYFCFDGDTAGEKATWRAVEQLLPRLRDGMKIYLMRLPDQHDPDTFIVQHGSSAFAQQQAQAPLLSDFFFSYLEKAHDRRTAEGKAAFVQEVGRYLSRMPRGIYRTLMVQKLAQQVALPESTLHAAMQTQQPHPKPTPAPVTAVTEQALKTALTRVPYPIKQAFIFLMHAPALIKDDAVTITIKKGLLTQLQSSVCPATALLAQLITHLDTHTACLSAAQVLTHWRARSQPPANTEHDFLLACSTARILLPPAHWHQEFKAVLANCQHYVQQRHIDTLLKKAQGSGLSVAEKKTLQDCLRQQKKVKT